MENRFYIGQDVVCIDDSGVPIESGRFYNIRGIVIKPCSCAAIMVDVGITAPFWGDFVCHKCKEVYNSENRQWYFYASRFKPLDYLTDISELVEVLDRPLFEIFNHPTGIK